LFKDQELIGKSLRVGFIEIIDGVEGDWNEKEEFLKALKMFIVYKLKIPFSRSHMCDYFRVISINSHIYTIDFHALEEHV
jgi:hypothetical protein